VIPQYTLGERVADGTIHIIGVAASLAALVALLIVGIQTEMGLWVLALTIYGIALVSTFACSAGYHLIVHPKVKEIFRRLDHAAIFLMIAGTYTPFTLGVLRDSVGAALFTVVWAIAIMGISLKAFGKVGRPMVSTGLYIAMGWLIVFAIGPLIAAVPPAGMAWLLAGGLSYSLGVVFFVTDSRIP
jgi:hemolysin III